MQYQSLQYFQSIYNFIYFAKLINQLELSFTLVMQLKRVQWFQCQTCLAVGWVVSMVGMVGVDNNGKELIIASLSRLDD